MINEGNQIDAFELKVLITTMILSHQYLIASLEDPDLYDICAVDIAYRMNERADTVEKALAKLKEAGWLVFEECQTGPNKIKLTFKSWDVYRSFSIMTTDPDIEAITPIGNYDDISDSTLCRAFNKCHAQEIRNKWKKKFLDEIQESMKRVVDINNG